MTFLQDDVTLLLKDITGQIEPLSTKQREKLIQSGVHYSEMLPLEYEPSAEYLELFYLALDKFAVQTAEAAATLATRIYRRVGKDTVLVSLARAGTPVGILIKRYLKYKFNVDVPHYTISIIRGRGIDENALNYILNRHAAKNIQFIDGWTGKGAIQRELETALCKYPSLLKGRDTLAVLSDPANVTDMCGTHDDFLIASSCLNSTVCGLMSRTIFRSDLIDKNDCHGVVFYRELAERDLTYDFINRICKEYEFAVPLEKNSETSVLTGLEETKSIAEKFGITDINFVKPGIGETTRVLLRRVPDCVLISNTALKESVSHIFKLAAEKGVRIIKHPLKLYNACGIIKKLSADA